MNQNSSTLSSLRGIFKLYEQIQKEVCAKYRLTQMEVNIISFLHNNPGRDTAADIVELRMLPKGHVSQGVEALIQKGLLSRCIDERDRRRIHLSLTPQAVPIVEEIDRGSQQFYGQLFFGFSEEERETYALLGERIRDNAKIGLERKKLK